VGDKDNYFIAFNKKTLLIPFFTGKKPTFTELYYLKRYIVGYFWRELNAENHGKL